MSITVLSPKDYGFWISEWQRRFPSFAVHGVDVVLGHVPLRLDEYERMALKGVAMVVIENEEVIAYLEKVDERRGDLWVIVAS